MGFLTNLFEKRAHPSANIDWLRYGFGGGSESAAGVNVTPENALTVTAVWACIKVLSENTSALPLQLFKRLDGGGKERAVKNPLYDILHMRPNPEMTSMVFRETSMSHLVGWGNWYSSIVRDGSGQVTELWPLLPNKMEVIRDKENTIYFRYTLPDGKQKILPQRDVLHIPGLSFDGLVGYNPITKLREAIGLSLATEEYGARFFGNGARPGAILEHPEHLGAEAQSRLKDSWNDIHQGLENSHRLAILEEGMKLKEFGVPPEDAQFLQTRQFQVVEIARFFNVPPHMIQDLERATFSNIEEQDLYFVKHTLTPWLVRIEQSLSCQLLSDSQRKRYFFEHNVNGLLRGDYKSRNEAYSVGRMGGWFSVNDIRAMENMNPVDDGDIYLSPLNMVPADQAEDVMQVDGGNSGGTGDAKKSLRAKEEYRVKPPVGRDRIRNAFIPLFKDAASRIVNMESNAVAKAVNKYLNKRSQAEFDSWLDGWYGEDFPEKVKAIMGPVMRGYADQINTEALREAKEDGELTPEMIAFIDEYIDGYVGRHVSSSVGQIRALLRDDGADAPDEIDTRAAEWKETRADKISTRETEREGNAVAQMAFWGIGLPTFWRIRGPKTCPYCKELEGRKIRSGQAFIQPGTEWEPSGAKDGPMIIRGLKKHPPLHKGCDCFISMS